MSDVQRWGNGSWPEWNVPEEDGMYVLFTDHERAVAEAVAAEREACAQAVWEQWAGSESPMQDTPTSRAFHAAITAIRARGQA